jgi:hypothetical protein
MQITKYLILLIIAIQFICIKSFAQEEINNPKNELYLLYDQDDSLHWELQEIKWAGNHDFWLWFNFKFHNLNNVLKFIVRDRVNNPANIRTVSLAELANYHIRDAAWLEKFINEQETNPDSVCDFFDMVYRQEVYIIIKKDDCAKIMKVDSCIGVFE